MRIWDEKKQELVIYDSILSRPCSSSCSAATTARRLCAGSAWTPCRRLTQCRSGPRKNAALSKPACASTVKTSTASRDRRWGPAQWASWFSSTTSGRRLSATMSLPIRLELRKRSTRSTPALLITWRGRNRRQQKSRDSKVEKIQLPIFWLDLRYASDIQLIGLAGFLISTLRPVTGYGKPDIEKDGYPACRPLR